MGRDEDYITSTSSRSLIFLLSARSISYTSDSQSHHLIGQRYTPRSIIGDMLSESCGGVWLEIVLEEFSPD